MTTFTSTLRAGVLGAALAGAVAAWPAYACADEERSQASKESNIGALTGLALGAAAAGPVGAVVGAAAGVVLGDRYHRQAKARTALVTDLGHSEAERERLNASVAQLDSSLAQARSHGSQVDQTLQQTDELTFEVGFRTDDDSIPAARMPPLLKLGALLTSMPEAHARVAGYADPRGSDSYNQELSLRRAQSVAAALMSAGVPRERILIEAHGKSESTSAKDDLDAYALERRVTVRLELSESGQVARRD
ncbi:MAG TPA: OmpA family protein [Steroidobacteraceae bacterium]|jgi:outer membrane protein OmpA-like peptidoglycan-associated protein|nr:OmpA family protein [Steroidobacteraceae bacterium]